MRDPGDLHSIEQALRTVGLFGFGRVLIQGLGDGAESVSLAALLYDQGIRVVDPARCSVCDFTTSDPRAAFHHATTPHWPRPEEG